MKYKIQLQKNVKKQLKNLDQKQATRILSKISLLSENPYPAGVEQLRGKKAYRIRVGDYRVIYEIYNEELVVWVVRVGHRRDVYKR